MRETSALSSRSESENDFFDLFYDAGTSTRDQDREATLIKYQATDTQPQRHVCSTPPLSPSRLSSGLLSMSFKAHKQRRAESPVFLSSPKSRISLENMLFDAVSSSTIILPKESESESKIETDRGGDLKYLLNSLEQQCNGSKTSSDLLVSPIGFKYNLKRSDSQLMALATAVRAWHSI
jgi:hypothetical protein